MEDLATNFGVQAGMTDQLIGHQPTRLNIPGQIRNDDTSQLGRYYLCTFFEHETNFSGSGGFCAVPGPQKR